MLEHKPHAAAEVLQRIILDVYAINQHFSVVDIVQSGNQLYKAGLAAGGRADDPNCFARINHEIDIVQHPVFTVLVIFEVNIFEFHLAVPDSQIRVLRVFIRQIGFCIKDFIDPPG